jgi:hypothetical protein
VSEGLRRSTTELRRNDLNQSRAGGTRTHDFRLIMLYSNSAVDRCLLLFLSQRKERESNPQGLSCKLGRLPTGSRRHSVCASILCLSSSTRNRTWNFSLEARDDIRFTIEPCCLRQLIEPTERKARESNPHLYSRTALAVQPSKPYLATFQVIEWSHRDSNSGFRHAMAMSSRWTMTPFHTKVRSRIELDLRSYQERVLPEHLQTITFSDRGRNRTFGFLRVMQVS